MNRAYRMIGGLDSMACRRFLFLPLFLLTAAGCSPAPVGADATPPSVQEPAATQRSAADRSVLPRLKVIRDLPTPGGGAGGVIWSSDGTKLAAFGTDPGAGVPPLFYIPNDWARLITIWNADGTVFRQLRRSQPFIQIGESFAFVGDDKQIAAPPPIDADDLVFSVFDIATGNIAEEVHRSPDTKRLSYREKLVASPDQSILAIVFDGPEPRPVALYSTRDWSKLPDLPDSSKFVAENPAAVAFSRDSKLLAVCNLHGTVLIYDLGANRVIQRIDAFPDIGVGGGPSIAFSPDGTMIAVGSAETENAKHLPGGGFETSPAKNPVRVFNVQDGSRIVVYSGPYPGAKALAWSPDGRFLTFITGYRVLHVWNLFWIKDSGFRGVFQPRIGEWKQEFGSTSSVAFSPNGRRLAVDDGHDVRVFGVSP